LSYPVSIDLIKARLIDRIDQLVPYLYPAARQDGREWKLGSIAGEPGQSLAIHRVGAKAGWWKDFGGTDGGDILDLVAAALTNGDVRAAIPRAIELANLGHVSGPERAAAERSAAEARARKEAEEARDEAARARAAKAHYLRADRLRGSMAEAYLRHRGLWMPDPFGPRPDDDWFRALRSHPGLKDPETGAVRPAMVAAVQRLKGGIVTIHRTFLERLPSGLVVKATAMQKPKCAYSGYRGGFIPINRGWSGKAIADLPDGEWVTVAEGVEDAVAIALAAIDRRVVSAISLSNIGGLDLPRRIGGVFIHRHRGDDAKAEQAYHQAVGRLVDRGLSRQQIRELWAPGAFKDFTAVYEAAYAERLAETAAIAGVPEVAS
jgi:hypothetical protein